AHPRRGSLPAGGGCVVSRDGLDRGDAGLPARVREGSDIPAQPTVLFRHAAPDVLPIPGGRLGDGQRHRRRPHVSVLREIPCAHSPFSPPPPPRARPYRPSCRSATPAWRRGGGVRFCPTTSLVARVPMRDGVPIDVDVTLPPTGDGPFPTIVM